MSELKKFYKEIGVDEILSETPLNRFEESHALQISDTKSALQQTEEKTAENPRPRIVAPPLVSPQELQKEASHQAQRASSLEELKREMELFEGCPLRYTATQLVFGDGNPDSDLMVIGEAPGADEDRLGRPFVGLSGQLLDRMFQCIGLDRTKLYITNIVPWRPPGNRQPSSSEISLCLPFLKRHIALVQPKILLLVGGVSAKTILQRSDGIMKLRGKWWEYELPDARGVIPTLAMYHPAYLLRSPGQKREAWKDLLLLQERLMKN